jgi:hypothetical protein
MKFLKMVVQIVFFFLLILNELKAIVAKGLHRFLRLPKYLPMRLIEK